jgi:epoxyqueuosine reductase
MTFTIPIADRIKHAAREAGFELCGIAPVSAMPELEYFPEWIEAGHAGEMRYLESRDEEGRLKRAALQNAAPWARSVIVCALNYNTEQPQSSESAGSDRGWISRYAWGGAEKPADYHDVVMSRLGQVETLLATSHPDVRTRCYVDTGPLIERVFAKYAGVGWIGKNTCIINQQLGSWLFLGVILTSLELQPDLPAADRCGSCTACLDACPTDAFIGPHELDATKCISYLTIEKRGEIPEELRAGMGRQVFGCDICQEVCPWNRKAPATMLEEFQPQSELVNPELEWLATMAVEEFRQRFRGSPIQRAKHAGLRRNAIVAMGNSGNENFVPILEQIAADPDPNLSSHAHWALRRLAQTLHCEVPPHTHDSDERSNTDRLEASPQVHPIQAGRPGDDHASSRR